jgi:hypothetical protein
MDGSKADNSQEAGYAALAVLEESEQRRREEFEVGALQLADDAANGNEPGAVGAVDNLRFWEVEEYARILGFRPDEIAKSYYLGVFAEIPETYRPAVLELLDGLVVQI